MKVTHKRKSKALRALGLGTLVLVMCALVPGAWAKPKKPDPARSVTVVAHVQFNGSSSTEMAIQRQASGDRYLYVGNSPRQGVSVFDVETPSQPKLVGSVPWPDAATTHIREVTGEAVLLSEADTKPAASPSAAPAASDPLVLWDTTKPDAPQVVRRFTKVSSVLADDRGYIYVLNSDGLWVISTPTAYQQNQPDPFDNLWFWAEYSQD